MILLEGSITLSLAFRTGAVNTNQFTLLLRDTPWKSIPVDGCVNQIDPLSHFLDHFTFMLLGTHTTVHRRIVHG